MYPMTDALAHTMISYQARLPGQSTASGVR
jgi:hypothetical protein